MDNTYYVMLGIDNYYDLHDHTSTCEICGSTHTEKPHMVGKVSRCNSTGISSMHIMMVCTVCSSALLYKK